MAGDAMRDNNCNMITLKDKCYSQYNHHGSSPLTMSPTMATSPTAAGSPGTPTPAMPVNPHNPHRTQIPFDVPKEILALATAPAPLHAAVEHRRCSSTDSLSLSCHLTPYSSTSSQGSPGSSHGSRGSSSCGSPPPPFYDSAPHYTDISNMTPRHQQPLQSNTGGGSGSGVGGAGGGLHQHHAAAAAAAGSPTIPVGPCVHVGSVGGAGAASVDMHHHHRVRRRRGHLNRFHSDTSEDICDPIGQEDFDPRKHQISEEELRPQPMSKKSRKNLVPGDNKDDKYWQRRKKNNMAAKRSRDARRIKENQIAMRANFLQKQNEQLQIELENAQADNQQLRKRLNKYENA